MRDELLKETLFFDLEHARGKVANWAANYNQDRAHSAIGYETPAAYAARLTTMNGRIRGAETFRRPPIAPSAHQRQSEAPTPASAG